MSPEPALADSDLALLGRLATRIVELRLETPAILALESARPVARVASQAMIFFEPFVLSLFRVAEYRRFTELTERPEALEALVREIEGAAERREQAVAAARAARRGGRARR